jgi:hypothetical protein
MGQVVVGGRPERRKQRFRPLGLLFGKMVKDMGPDVDKGQLNRAQYIQELSSTKSSSSTLFRDAQQMRTMERQTE